MFLRAFCTFVVSFLFTSKNTIWYKIVLIFTLKCLKVVYFKVLRVKYRAIPLVGRKLSRREYTPYPDNSERSNLPFELTCSVQCSCISFDKITMKRDTKLKNVANDKKDLDKYTRFFTLKATELIVQSRLGEKISTSCKPHSSGPDWVSL